MNFVFLDREAFPGWKDAIEIRSNIALNLHESLRSVRLQSTYESITFECRCGGGKDIR
jgi:hypothetical protein